MSNQSRPAPLGKGRRWVFRLIVGATMALAAYVIVMAAFFQDERFTQFAVSLPIPLVMATLVAIGLGWIVWVRLSRRRQVTRD